MIEIRYLQAESGANRFGTCNCCGKSSGEDPLMISVKFSYYGHGTLICLCDDCKKKLMEVLQPANNSEIPNSSDTISRQAAINAVEFGIKYVKVISEETALLREVNAELEKASDRIKQLPSTYPESSQVPHWHPVSEQPQEDDDYLLLTHEKTKYGTFRRIIIGAWNSATNEWFEEYEGMYRDVNHPVAWISMQELLLLKGYEATE